MDGNVEASVRPRPAYEPIVRGRWLNLPNNARVPVWTIVNVENWSAVGPMRCCGRR